MVDFAKPKINHMKKLILIDSFFKFSIKNLEIMAKHIFEFISYKIVFIVT